MQEKSSSIENIDRRSFIISLAASALLVVSGCATLRRESEIDAAFADLEALLKASDEGDLNEVTSIVERIQAGSRKLLDTHETFLAQFNEGAIDRTVSSDDLNKLVDDYLEQRKEQRDDLLHLQDDLHTALPEDTWPEVREVLNRRTTAVAAGTA